MSYLALNDVALLEDLDDDILLLGAAELSLERSLGSGVEGTLVAVAVKVNVSYVLPKDLLSLSRRIEAIGYWNVLTCG